MPAPGNDLNKALAQRGLLDSIFTGYKIVPMDELGEDDRARLRPPGANECIGNKIRQAFHAEIAKEPQRSRRKAWMGAHLPVA
jgi:hypothetical protein